MGEMGLDYHYDNSPREIQREVLKKQLAVAIGMNKPLTIHTREADGDILQILKEKVPKEHRVSEEDVRLVHSSVLMRLVSYLRSTFTALPIPQN